jgi:hypothetical protein
MYVISIGVVSLSILTGLIALVRGILITITDASQFGMLGILTLLRGSLVFAYSAVAFRSLLLGPDEAVMILVVIIILTIINHLVAKFIERRYGLRKS